MVCVSNLKLNKNLLATYTYVALDFCMYWVKMCIFRSDVRLPFKIKINNNCNNIKINSLITCITVAFGTQPKTYQGNIIILEECVAPWVHLPMSSRTPSLLKSWMVVLSADYPVSFFWLLTWQTWWNHRALYSFLESSKYSLPGSSVSHPG